MRITPDCFTIAHAKGAIANLTQKECRPMRRIHGLNYPHPGIYPTKRLGKQMSQSKNHLKYYFQYIYISNLFKLHTDNLSASLLHE